MPTAYRYNQMVLEMALTPLLGIISKVINFLPTKPLSNPPSLPPPVPCVHAGVCVRAFLLNSP